jgi:hypothetical protein
VSVPVGGGGRDGGFAIALLMWMIAGMSLLVTAVIHFAQDDIGLAEQRLSEAKSEALARGVALLVLRDAALAPYFDKEGAQAGGERRDRVGKKNEENQSRSKIFTQRYMFDGHVASASVHPASGFVSLDGGSEEELRRLFGEIGGADEAKARALAGAVNDYREQRSPVSAAMGDFLGFRAREELLAVTGMRKSIYDRVKDYVQPYEVSGLDVSVAPPGLQSAFGDLGSVAIAQQAGRGEVSRSRGSAVSSPVEDGLVTFESLNRRKAAALAANTVMAVLVDIELQSGGRTSYQVWVSGAKNAIISAKRTSTTVSAQRATRG